MERAGIALLPVLLLAPIALQADASDRYAAPGPFVTTAFRYDEPSLRGGPRRVKLRGALPRSADAPCLLLAAPFDAVPETYDPLTRHLASHGCAAILVERPAGEPWFRYADAVEAAAWQLRTEIDSPDSPLHGRLDADRLLVVGEGDGAASAVRAAAGIADPRGLVLIDPKEPGPALTWLAHVHVPLLVLGTASGDGTAARAWFDAAAGASGAPAEANTEANVRRWLVEFETDRPLAAKEGGSGSVLQRDVRALVAAFADAQLNLHDETPPAFAEIARIGRVDRKVRDG